MELPAVRFPQSIAVKVWVQALFLYMPMLVEVVILPFEGTDLLMVDAL